MKTFSPETWHQGMFLKNGSDLSRLLKVNNTEKRHLDAASNLGEFSHHITVNKVGWHIPPPVVRHDFKINNEGVLVTTFDDIHGTTFDITQV